MLLSGIEMNILTKNNANLLEQYNWHFSVLAGQSCLTLHNPSLYSPPGSSVHKILKTRILKWVVIPFSRRSSWPRNWTQISCIAGRFFTVWATREAHNWHSKCNWSSSFLKWASLIAQMVKNWHAIQETQVLSLGEEDSLEKRMAVHSSILAWIIPRTEELCRLQSMGVSKSQTQMSIKHFLLEIFLLQDTPALV